MPTDDDDALDALLAAPPCTAAESRAKAERMRLRNERVTRHLPLVFHFAGLFAGKGVETGDLVQVGSLGLMRAAELFDESRGPFSSYASTWIRASMGRAIDRARAEAAEAVGDAVDDVVDAGSVGPLEALAADERAGRVRDAVATLPANHRGVVVARFGLGGGGPLTLAEVAARLGVTKQRVHQIEGAALARLRSLLSMEADGAGMA